jgi:hypothetical protein
MHGLTSGPGTVHSFVRSAILLAACILALALLLLPVALRQRGSGGPMGLIIAAAICLVSGMLSELIAAALFARATPLGATLAGMAVRMILPLGLCVALVATGQSGRQHLAFIGYLLTFYVVTLVLETWLAVKRTSDHSTSLRQNSR